MIYLTSGEVLKIIVLETENIEELQKGRPIKTPDGKVLIAWCPDPEWLVEKLPETGGDARAIAELIDEAAKRPQKELRPYHKPTQHKFE